MTRKEELQKEAQELGLNFVPQNTIAQLEKMIAAAKGNEVSTEETETQEQITNEVEEKTEEAKSDEIPVQVAMPVVEKVETPKNSFFGEPKEMNPNDDRIQAGNKLVVMWINEQIEPPVINYTDGKESKRARAIKADSASGSPQFSSAKIITLFAK